MTEHPSTQPVSLRLRSVPTLATRQVVTDIWFYGECPQCGWTSGRCTTAGMVHGIEHRCEQAVTA